MAKVDRLRFSKFPNKNTANIMRAIYAVTLFCFQLT